ncbi:MAG: hypothetical protein QNK55_06850, partial [Saprospiraceae bacterium]
MLSKLLRNAHTKATLFVFVFFYISIFSSYGQGNDIVLTYNTNDNFTIPGWVTEIKVEVWGAGAPGLSGIKTKGGGGGAYAESTLMVTPGQLYNVVIGIGGSPGGSPGGNSIFGNNLVLAAGGINDQGGLASSSIGGYTSKGGNGGEVSMLLNHGGGGGAAAGPGGSGANGDVLMGGDGIGESGSGGSIPDANDSDGSDGTVAGGGGAGNNGPLGGISGNGANGRIKITYPALEVSFLECSCSNDQTPGETDGTYSTILVVKRKDGEILPLNLNFAVNSAEGLKDNNGLLLDGTNFSYCSEESCGAGVSSGQYFLNVLVEQSPGDFSVQVGGLDLNGDGNNDMQDLIGFQDGQCVKQYPELPVFPTDLSAKICLLDGVNSFNSVPNAIYSEINSVTNIYLSDSLSQEGAIVDVNGNTSGSTVLKITPKINQNSNPYKLFLMRQTDGCKMTEVDSFEVYNPVNPSLDSLHISCWSLDSIGIEIDLRLMSSSVNTGGGTFYINEEPVVDGKFKLTDDPTCESVTYQITDECGVPHTSEPTSLLVSFKPEPNFDLSSQDVASYPSTSFECATESIELTITNLTGGNTVFTLQAGNGSSTIIDSNSPLILANPDIEKSIRYTICMKEEKEYNCSVFNNVICADSLCKEIVLYQDPTSCGTNQLFDPICEPIFDGASNDVLCPITTKDQFGLEILGFSIPFVDVVNCSISTDTSLYSCDADIITGKLEACFFGLGNPSGGRLVKDLEGFDAVCGIFDLGINLGLLGTIKPLGFLYNILRCGETVLSVIQQIAGTISKIAGGDGGGYLA